MFFRLPESIKYLLSNGSFEEAKIELDRLFKIDHIPEAKKKEISRLLILYE